MPQSSTEIQAAYDLAAVTYADRFVDELIHKPRDLELLKQFAAGVGLGQRVLDLGCGPGHTTSHLASLGLRPVGVDLSPAMVSEAKTRFPAAEFTVGDFFRLPDENGSVAGLLAFYCIVHLQPEQLVPAFSEMFRVLKVGGILLLAFHVGSGPVHVDNFLDTGAALEFSAFAVADVQSALLSAGFTDIRIHERPPYETEYPSHRCYIFGERGN